MLKFLPIGQEDFREIIENNGYYVDKTGLIKKLLETRNKVTLFTRPRRFGKTLAVSMLQNFFENTGEEKSGLFDGLLISKEQEICEKYIGQFPVISLSLKGAKQNNYHNALTSIKQSISKEFRRHEKVVLSYPYEKERIDRLLNASGDEADYLDALQFLSQILYDAYGRKVIVLLDEYDVPLENAYFEGFYDKMVSFIRSLFESVLKTNACLEFAVITGCLFAEAPSSLGSKKPRQVSEVGFPTKLEKTSLSSQCQSIFTGLNNLRIISILDKAYEEYFGFTESEVKDILDYYHLSYKMELVAKWYDGYKFGNKEIYNPWSVLNFISDLREDENAAPKPYWSNTSSNSIIRKLIENADVQLKKKIEDLVAGGTIESPVHEDITYADIDKSEENLWNFMYFTGYLRKISQKQEQDQAYMVLKIPNVEVCYLYKSKIMEWMQERIRHENLQPFYEAIMQEKPENLQEELTKYLQGSISFYDSKEAFYHGFLLGLLKQMSGYIVESNREAGDGRFDILIRSLDVKKPVVLMELKVADTFHGMENQAKAAPQQINKKHYTRELQREGYDNIICYGIAFYGKNCSVSV